MVNTRNTNFVLNTPPPTDPIQAVLAAIQETLANIEVKAHSTDIDNLKKGAGTSQPRTDELTIQQRLHPEPNNTLYGKLIRIEFPKFSGDDYVKRYLDNTLWEHFDVEVVKRFGVLYDDPIVEVKNLKQTGSVQNYQEAFKALLNRVDLPEPIAVSMFIGGLKPEVGTPIRMFQANNLSESYQLARMQEATNTILKPRYNTPLLPTPKQSTTTFASKAVTTPVKSNLVGQSSGYVTRNVVHKPYKLTQKELEEKRAKGQCFYCDQKFVPGHKCSGQLHSIEVICEGDIDNCIDGDDDTYEDCVGEMFGVTDTPQITLNALFGLNSYQTMRIRGRVVQLCQMESVESVSAEVEQVLTKFDEVFDITPHVFKSLTTSINSQYTVMSDSEDSTVTYTAVSSPFEDGSDIGSPGVDGPPIMPEEPYAYIMAAYQFDPEEEPEEDDEDPEEDPTDYPADRDDDDDEEEEETFGDDADDEDEDEDEDEEEEEEHPAPTNS
ncbi:reverse transcriptase, partial [Tanacetum coccineum]